MSCPCMYPIILTIIDDDGDKTTYWSMPDDELVNENDKNGKENTFEGFKIPRLDNITEKGRDYMAVMWRNPKNIDLTSYIVNDHIVYAGCSFGDKIKRNGKMTCKEKELYIVLHPIDEWNFFHIRELKA